MAIDLETGPSAPVLLMTLSSVEAPLLALLEKESDEPASVEIVRVVRKEALEDDAEYAGSRAGESGVLEIMPFDAKLPNRRSERTEFQVQAGPIWQGCDSLSVRIEPFAM